MKKTFLFILSFLFLASFVWGQNDQTSFVMFGYDPGGTNIPSTYDTSSEITHLLTIGIVDAGSGDGLDTEVTNFRLTPHSTNTADWTNNIQGIILHDGVNPITTGYLNITDTFIDIPIASGNLTVPDGVALGLELYVYLNTANIEDNETISFFIDADNHGFTADSGGSGFASNFGTDINSSDFIITVTATESQFTSVPSTAVVNTDFIVSAAATDENGNIDEDNEDSIELSRNAGTGAVSATNLTSTLTDGTKIWDDVQYDTVEDDITLDVVVLALTTATSSTIDITAGESVWVINEIHADPDLTISGDANGDGVRDAEDDEFVELINNSETSVDISGWTLSDEIGLKHTFANNTIIPANNAIVVFGGGTPTGSFGGASVVVASTGSLDLNNTGDTITLDNGSDAEVVTYTYFSEANDDQSITRDPDITGSFVKHSLASGSGGALFSPGNNANGTPLPVTLSDFSTAIIMNEFVQVSWTTQSESSINSWNLYRSTEINSEQVLLNTQAGTNTVQPTVYTFEDHEVDESVTYYYYLEATEYDGTSNMWGPITAFLEDSGTQELPTTSILQSNYPNPFNPSTTIMCDIKDGEEGKLTIYNSRGQVIESQMLDAGEHIIEWDGTQYGSGVYLYKLETLSYTKTRKMLMIK